VKSAATSGAAMGYPMIQARAVVVGGRYVQLEATELAYSAAAGLAFRNALEAVGCAILEPIMKLEIHVPEEYMGGVVNDLNRRRAEITDVEPLEGFRAIKGVVPIAEMFGYATMLRSLSQGRGSYTLEPFQYRAIPESIRKQLFGAES
ncbi:MAG: elongation factor G, partial [Planctomycetes bacterium]|nr:elongation factor G [Planctomycetota bacterium]